jgi:hypothetical protein
MPFLQELRQTDVAKESGRGRGTGGCENSTPPVRRLVELGYDLNEGMAAIYGGKVYYGKDAVVLISSLTGDRDWMGVAS